MGEQAGSLTLEINIFSVFISIIQTIDALKNNDTIIYACKKNQSN